MDIYAMTQEPINEEISKENIMEDLNECVRVLSETGEDVNIDKTEEDHLLELISDMNFLESTILLKRVDAAINDLQGAKTLVEQVEAQYRESKEDYVNMKIIGNNVMAALKIEKDINQFKSEYQPSLTKYTNLKTKLEENIASYDNIEKNSKFMNDQMIDNLRKKRQMHLNNGFSEDDIRVRHYDLTITAFSNRLDYTYLLDKLDKPFKIKQCVKEWKMKQGKYWNKIYLKEFGRLFSGEQITIIESYIKSLFNENMRAAELLLFHLAKLLVSEKRSGKFIWVKVFLMNIMDIQSGIFDLEDGKEKTDQFILTLSSIYSKF